MQLTAVLFIVTSLACFFFYFGFYCFSLLLGTFLLSLTRNYAHNKRNYARRESVRYAHQTVVTLASHAAPWAMPLSLAQTFRLLCLRFVSASPALATSASSITQSNTSAHICMRECVCICVYVKCELKCAIPSALLYLVLVGWE